MTQMLTYPIFPDLREKHVLITGGSNGIGAALCDAFAAQGCALTMLDRDAVNGEKVLQSCSSHAASTALYQVDVTNLPVLTDTLARVRAERPVVERANS